MKAPTTATDQTKVTDHPATLATAAGVLSTRNPLPLKRAMCWTTWTSCTPALMVRRTVLLKKISLSVSVSVFLRLCLSLSLSVSLSISLCLSLFVSVSVSLSLSLSAYLSVCLSVCLSLSLSVSVYLSLSLSLSLCPPPLSLSLAVVLSGFSTNMA